MLLRPITALLLACTLGACASDASSESAADASTDTSADATPTVDASADASDSELVPDICDDMPVYARIPPPSEAGLWQIVGIGVATPDAACAAQLSLGCVTLDIIPEYEWTGAGGCGVRDDGTVAHFSYDRFMDILVLLGQSWRDCTEDEWEDVAALPVCDE